MAEMSGLILNTKRARSWLARAMAVALLAGMAMPMHAEDRAIKSRVAPVYPEIAKRMKIGGVVKLDVTVDADGKVTDVKPVSGNQMLSAAAQEAVRRWRFAPGTGEATMNIDINFNLIQ